ncbi:FAD/NAD(P)-binding domain-containing protein [Fistulina hepatica ATCC 64428]|nr:FAD/NAD(P)-binding domain-containing protein [Fistulina hepatica ATCC 64428]
MLPTSARFAVSALKNASKDKFKVLVIGAGSGGLSVANQIYNRFKLAGKALNDGDVAVMDAATEHYYQPGWTLVGSGLKTAQETVRPMASLIPRHIAHIQENVKAFTPTESFVTTTSGSKVSYDALVVATGLQINWGGIKGLPEALADPRSGVASIYSYNTAPQVWSNIESFRSGKALFTQPVGVVKCAGAPQKIMWMAWDRFRRTKRLDNATIDFYTGLPAMFSVKKYSDALDQLRKERDIGGYFQHNLIAIDAAKHVATFQKADGSIVDTEYTILHATPPMGPLSVMKGQPITDEAGWVTVDQDTLRHVNPAYGNIFALGDCSSLPTSKTIAAITAQAPVLTENLFSVMTTGNVAPGAVYDGYTSCPLLTGYGELMLAEFKYAGIPKETFSFLDQAKSHRLFYHLKKDFFPAVYWRYMVQGQWFGAKGIFRPSFN